MKKKITALRDKQTLQRQTVETTACNTKANYISFYYMAEFASGHLNSKWQLKMGPSCPFLRKKISFWRYNKSFIDQAFSVKMACIGLVLFCVFIDFDLVSVKKPPKGTWPISNHPELKLGQ